MLPVCCLQLPGFAIKKLLDAGFMYADDLFQANEDLLPEVEKLFKSYPDIQTTLKECLGGSEKTTALTLQEECLGGSEKTTALTLQEECLGGSEKTTALTLQEECLGGSEKTTALTLQEEERQCRRILTFSLRLDQLLGGGVPLGGVLEVCGAPGSGKTQLCLQLCVSVQLHTTLGGLAGEAVYIDTDAGFSPQRLTEISQECKEHCCNIARSNKLSAEVIQVLESQSYNQYYYISVQDHLQLLGTVLSLDEFIREHPKVKLVIIDSLAFPFLHLNDMLKRTMMICKLIKCLGDLAQRYGLSVVVTNHLTTRITRGEDQLIPALGECVGHLINNRLILGFLPPTNQFAGVIFKSPSLQNGSAEFKVTKGGIRDVQ